MKNDNDEWWFKIFGKKIKMPFPIASMINSSSAVVLGQKVFGSDNKSVFVNSAYAFFKKINDIKYWFLYRFSKKHQFYLINTRLKPGYYDIDWRMLHGMMALLCEYIELEEHGEEKFAAYIDDMRNSNWGCPPDQISEAQSLLSIYRWWKYDRPTNHARLEEMRTQRYSKVKTIKLPCVGGVQLQFDESAAPYTFEQLHEIEDKLNQDDNDMLHALIDARKSMWT